VTVRLDTEAAAFSGELRATGVRLTSDDVLTADVYIAATGIKPNVDFLRDSGIDVAWGVRTDERLKTTAPDVFAAGDVAETRNRLTGERYVHAIFPNAVAQGRIVGYNLLGYDAVYEGAETMNSLKHLGLQIVAIGLREAEREIRSRRGNVLRKFVLNDGKIVGVRLAGDIRGAGFYHALMLRGADVRGFEDHLLEPGFGAGSLALSA
jgi:NAD(P)H-nitrite reductase large subunit